MARLRVIDWLLDHYGSFNRATLMDFHGLSQPQVSLDIGAYIHYAPDNVEYDKSARCYKRTINFKRVLP